jgi:prephenate dehydrogenase
MSLASTSTYTVGIVGATGAVGKEIRNCLEARHFPVSTLRIFGSERSAGTKIQTEQYGTITVELFDVNTAKQCDVVFLAVNGDFSLEHAHALSDGPDGCVVIDNSVREVEPVQCSFSMYLQTLDSPYLIKIACFIFQTYSVGLSIQR